MNKPSIIVGLFLAASFPLFAENPVVASASPGPTQAPAASDAAAVQTAATADPLAEVLPVLEAKYPDFKDLQYKEGDHLSDLITRSNGKISFAPEELSTSTGVNLIATLPESVLYWRLGNFTPEKSWLDTETQLQDLAPTTTGVILDLRSNVAPDDYRGADQVLRFFAPSDATRFRYSEADSEAKSDTNPVMLQGGQYSFHSPIIVLIDKQTDGAAEALAACLQADGAIVMGEATAGKMGIFEEEKLSSGQVLRYYVSPVNLPVDPNATFKIPQHTLSWNQPVVPDVTLTINSHAEKSALTLIGHHEVTDVIGEEPDRHLMNEAALIQGNDPEWDTYLQSLKKKPVLLSLPVIHDQALISALDSLKAIHASQKHTESTVQAAATPPPATSVQ
jgi:hypothetical protein